MVGIIEQSTGLEEVLKLGAPMLESRIAVAEYRLRVEIVSELFKLGADTSDASVSKIIDGLPKDVLYAELAKRA